MPKTINFPFVPNGKLMGFCAPLLKTLIRGTENFCQSKNNYDGILATFSQ